MAPYKNMYSRWHRYRDADGEKQIKRFGTTEVPNPVQEAGFTAWMRGTGPMTQAQYENVVKGIRRVCLGIPKTAEHREKMRQAKLGVPKSAEHRANMRRAQQRLRDARAAAKMEKTNEKHI